MQTEHKTAQEVARAVPQKDAVQEKESFGRLRLFLRKVGDELSGHAAELRKASDPNTDVVSLKELATSKFDYILEALDKLKINDGKIRRCIEVLTAVENHPKMLRNGLYSHMRRKYQIVINPD